MSRTTIKSRIPAYASFVEVPQAELRSRADHAALLGMSVPSLVDRAWRNGRYAVMSYGEHADRHGTPWRLVGVHRADNGRIGWEEMQRVRSDLFPDRWAIEAYPPADAEINAAHMRWLWVAPADGWLGMDLGVALGERVADE